MQPRAYFSAEIGFSNDVPTYSGGLGVLAGDHLKAAADAELPMVGVTLLYRQGYFRQHVGADGWQTESYPSFVPEPLLERLDKTVEITLYGPARRARARRISRQLHDVDRRPHERRLRRVAQHAAQAA